MAKNFQYNPPAFGHGNHEQGGDPGMSLRDYFAGQALAGLLPSKYVIGGADKIAHDCYELADKMLNRRSRLENG